MDPGFRRMTKVGWRDCRCYGGSQLDGLRREPASIADPHQAIRTRSLPLAGTT